MSIRLTDVLLRLKQPHMTSFVLELIKQVAHENRERRNKYARTFPGKTPLGGSVLAFDMNATSSYGRKSKTNSISRATDTTDVTDISFVLMVHTWCVLATLP